jgi:hypothetical protein
MAHAHSTLLFVFLPPLAVYLCLTTYHRFFRGLNPPPVERRRAGDYSGSEIAYALFIALSGIGCFITGLFLLDSFEPTSAYLCRLFAIGIGLPMMGGIVAGYTARIHLKGYSFQVYVFTAFLIQALLLFGALAFNAVADSTTARHIPVIVTDKRIKSSKGGGVPLVSFRVRQGHEETFTGIRDKKISRNIHDKTQPGDPMTLFVREGALGVPWMETLTYGDCQP